MKTCFLSIPYEEHTNYTSTSNFGDVFVLVGYTTWESQRLFLELTMWQETKHKVKSLELWVSMKPVWSPLRSAGWPFFWTVLGSVDKCSARWFTVSKMSVQNKNCGVYEPKNAQLARTCWDSSKTCAKFVCTKPFFGPGTWYVFPTTRILSNNQELWFSNVPPKNGDVPKKYQKVAIFQHSTKAKKKKLAWPGRPPWIQCGARLPCTCGWSSYSSWKHHPNIPKTSQKPLPAPPGAWPLHAFRRNLCCLGLFGRGLRLFVAGALQVWGLDLIRHLALGAGSLTELERMPEVKNGRKTEVAIIQLVWT